MVVAHVESFSDAESKTAARTAAKGGYIALVVSLRVWFFWVVFIFVKPLCTIVALYLSSMYIHSGNIHKLKSCLLTFFASTVLLVPAFAC